MTRLARLLSQHPGLQFDVRLSDSFCGLIKDGVDAAMRVRALDDSWLTAKRIGWQHLVICASPGYLQQRSMPTRTDMLQQHSFVVFRNPTSGRGRPVQLQVDGGLHEFHPPARTLIYRHAVVAGIVAERRQQKTPRSVAFR